MCSTRMSVINSQDDARHGARRETSPPRRLLETVTATSPVPRAAAAASAGQARSEAEITELLDTVSSETQVIDRLGEAVDDLLRVRRAKLQLQRLTPQELRVGLQARTRTLPSAADPSAAGGAHP
jgi:hypothetical protein